jgi:transposase
MDAEAFVPNAYYLGRLLQGRPEKPDACPSTDERKAVELQYLISKSENNVEKVESPGCHYYDLYYGAVYLLEQICADLTGLSDDLAFCFPNTYKQILSLAYYLVLEDRPTCHRFERWAFDHKHPYEKVLTSQRISDLLIDGFPENQKLLFFERQASRRLEDEYLAYDTTSISSTSSLIKSAKYGRNKDEENLPQINLAMIVGEKSRLPVYYRMLPGNIADVATITKLIKDMSFLQGKVLSFVLDRGFYSAKNINELYKNNYNYILAARKDLKLVKEIYNSAKTTLSNQVNNIKYYNSEIDVYSLTEEKLWNYNEKNNDGLIITEQNRKITIHTYYNESRGIGEKHQFLKNIDSVVASVENNEILNKLQSDYLKNYFIVKRNNNNRIIDIFKDEEKIANKCLDFGYFTLVTNKDISAIEVLKIYRQKDIIEKVFDNLKDRLSIKRTEVHSDRSFNNKLFVCFIALIIISYIDKKMKEKNLYKNYTMEKLLDTLDVIKICNNRKAGNHFSEITAKQRQLYEQMGVLPPS